MSMDPARLAADNVTTSGSSPSKRHNTPPSHTSSMGPTRLIPIPTRPSNAATTHVKAHSSAKPKPKRPLSAFNLFYRYKRQKILAIRGNTNKDGITRLVQMAPGLEDYDTRHTSPSQVINDLRRNIIRNDLKDNLLPRDTRDRSHRKNEGAMNGTISFIELGKLMNTSWKTCDDFAKGVFNELSNEGREHYRKRMDEYNSSSEVIQMKEMDETKTVISTTKKQDNIGSRKSNKNDDAKKAAAKPEYTAPDDGSAKTETETAEVTMEHLREYHSIPTSDNIDHASTPSLQGILRAPAPSLQCFQPNRDVSYAGGANTQAQVTRRTVHHTTPRTVSKDCSVPKEIQHESAYANNLMLRIREIEKQLAPERLRRLRVRELEGQIASERLRRRMRELEGLLLGVGSRPAVENQLRAEMETFPHVGLGRRAPGTGLVANRPPEARWPLANTSMIHPCMRASERADMLWRMMAMRHQQERHALSFRHPRMVDAAHQEPVDSSIHWSPSHAMPRQNSSVEELEYANHRKRMDCITNNDSITNNGAPEKKQRHN